jgi:nucleotide-binding universal stress UspA family protein
MKSLMLHVAQDEGYESRMQVALDIARHLESHLTLVQPALAQDFVAQAYKMAEKARADMKAKVEADLANEGVNWDWQVIEASSRAAILAEAARLSDISIVSLDEDRRGSTQPVRSLAGDLAMSSRTPILAVPHMCKGFTFGKAVIAYDGGPEASFALRCAIPLLAQCAHVVIAEVSDDPAAYPLTDAADYLGKYGIKARIEPVDKGIKTIEEQLLRATAQFEADFLVMGAYGHSRWREALFGGVTHYVLAETKVPILLAH